MQELKKAQQPRVGFRVDQKNANSLPLPALPFPWIGRVSLGTYVPRLYCWFLKCCGYLQRPCTHVRK